jgi:hypothetical protein
LCYIGESEHFEERIRDYLLELNSMRSGPSLSAWTLEGLRRAAERVQSESEVRVGSLIQIAEQNRTKVELQLIDFPEFVFNRVEISPSSLTDPFHRRAMENLAILDARVSGVTPLNRGRTTEAKVFQGLLKHRAKLPPPDILRADRG